MSGLLSVAEARRAVLALASEPAAEELALAEAAGRVLIRPAEARLTQPPFDASAMDGYAVRAADLPGTLTVVGQSAAGAGWQGALGPGQAVRILTGAPVPAGADRVVMQEDVVRDGPSLRVPAASERTNIRPRGNDFAQGDTLAPGRPLSAGDIALLAAMNVPRVTVGRAPSVAILAGGDELVRPGDMPGPDQIVSSNDLAVAALVAQAGAVPVLLPIARDTPESLRAGFEAGTRHDVLVTIGGASVGDHDLVAQIGADMGLDRAFHRIAMRPGKPLLAGRLGRTVMLGLPGNPVSAVVCAILFLQPLLRAMQGQADPGPAVRTGRLGRDLPPEGDREHYQRATLAWDEGPVVTPFGDQDSARLALLAQADALLVRPAGDPARRAGDTVQWIALR